MLGLRYALCFLLIYIQAIIVCYALHVFVPINCIICVGRISLSSSFWIMCLRVLWSVSHSLMFAFEAIVFIFCLIYLHPEVLTWTSVFWSHLFLCGLFPSRMVHCQPLCFPFTFHSKFCTPPQDIVHHQLKTFSGKLFERLRRLLQTLFLSAFHCKLDIRYLVHPYKAFHLPCTNPYALDNHAFPNEWCCSAKWYSTMIQQRKLQANYFHRIYRLSRQWLPQQLCPCSLGLLSSALFV